MLTHFRRFTKLIPASPFASAPMFNFASTADTHKNDKETQSNTDKKTPKREKGEISTSSSSEDEKVTKRRQRANLKNVALVLSGSGVQDGSEITEAVSFLISFGSRKIKHQCFAPNKDQADVVNHLTGKGTQEKRNVLVESARIARGQVKDLKELNQADYDAVFFPGGFGAAKNLSDYGSKSDKLTVDSEVERVLRDFHANQKPIGLACISPVLAAKVLGEHNVGLTVGNKGDGWPYGGTIEALEKLGAKHVVKSSTAAYGDTKNLVFTAPAFMRDTTNYHEVFQSVDNLVALVEKNLTSSKTKAAAKKEAAKVKRAEKRERKTQKKAAKQAEKDKAEKDSDKKDSDKK